MKHQGVLAVSKEYPGKVSTVMEQLGVLTVNKEYPGKEVSDDSHGTAGSVNSQYGVPWHGAEWCHSHGISWSVNSQ